jgi:hypothetical protein
MTLRKTSLVRFKEVCKLHPGLGGSGGTRGTIDENTIPATKDLVTGEV